MPERRRRARIARLVVAGGLGGALVVTQLGGASAVPSAPVSSPAAAAAVPHKCPDPDRVGPPAVIYEGLPDRDIPCVYNYARDTPAFDPTNLATWTGFRQGGVVQALRARQAFRLPNVLIAGVVPAEVVKPKPGDGATVITNVRAFVTSPAGAVHRYGDLPDFKVRTLAFGAVPAEVTVHVEQPRTAEDVPQGIVAQVGSVFDVKTGSNQFGAVSGSGQLLVEITRVELDGRSVDIGRQCRTQGPAELDIPEAENPTHSSKQFDPGSDYEPFKGGTIRARLSIPRFTGCVSKSGDDLSPIFTNLVSGPGNPVVLKFSNLSSTCFPMPDNAKCPATAPLPALPTKDEPDL